MANHLTVEGGMVGLGGEEPESPHGQHPITDLKCFACLHVCMSIMAPVALLIIPGRRDPPLCVPSQDFFLAD